MTRKPRYTFEECKKTTKRYSSYDIFKEEQPSMFKFIKKHCWCSLLYSHMHKTNKRLKYNIDNAKITIKKI